MPAVAQIITSKAEAQQNSVYYYTDETNNTLDDHTLSYVDNEDDRLYGAEYPVNDTIKTKQERRAERLRKKKRQQILNTDPDPDFIPAPEESYFAQQLVNNAMEFEGAAYRTGGTTPDGVDCSGMIYTVFNIFNIELPRASYNMAEAGKKIKLKNVKKGDLLFFDNNPRRKRINHVGLVVEITEDGEVKFLHASLQLGVIISSLEEPYYEKSFVQANRVIED